MCVVLTVNYTSNVKMGKQEVGQPKAEANTHAGTAQKLEPPFHICESIFDD